MLLCLSEANQPTASSELKKAYIKSGIQIVYGNEKLGTMLSQFNASQNSRQTIGNTHNGSRLSLVSWLRGLLAYIKYQSNYYLREESKKECQEDTTENKADKLLISL